MTNNADGMVLRVNGETIGQGNSVTLLKQLQLVDIKYERPYNDLLQQSCDNYHSFRTVVVKFS